MCAAIMEDAEEKKTKYECPWPWKRDINCITYLKLTLMQNLSCGSFCQILDQHPTIVLAFYYVVDVLVSSVSNTTYYRTNKFLENYAYVYNLVYYPMLFSITISIIYFIVEHFPRVIKKKDEGTTHVNHKPNDSDDDEDELITTDFSEDSYTTQIRTKHNVETQNTTETKDEKPLTLLQDFSTYFKIYLIMALSDTILGLMFTPAILYLPAIDVQLLGRIVILFNMAFCFIVFKREYGMAHFTSVLLLLVGVGLKVFSNSDFSVEAFTNTTVEGEIANNSKIFFSLILLIIVVEIFAAASSVYKEYVLRKYNLQPLRLVMIVSVLQQFISPFTILFLCIPLPAPWFYVAPEDLGTYIYNATMFIISTTESPNEDTDSMTRKYFLIYYSIFLITNILANVVDIVFIKKVSSTFNIMVNVSVIVFSVFSLNWKWLAGEAHVEITKYDLLAVFFVVMSTIAFKKASTSKFDTISPSTKTAIPIDIVVIKEKKENTEMRVYDLKKQIVPNKKLNTLRNRKSNNAIGMIKDSSFTTIPLTKYSTESLESASENEENEDASDETQ